MTTRDAAGGALEIDTLGPREWDRILGEFADASYEQTAAYVDACWGAGRTSHLLLRRGGIPVAGARVVMLGVPGLRGGLAYVKFGPFWRRRDAPEDAALHRTAVTALVDEYCRRRAHCLTIVPRPHPRYCAEESTNLADLDFAVRRPMVDPNRYLVDLGFDPATRVGRLDQKWRYNLRQALRHGITCRLADGVADVAAFERLHAAMVDRKRFASADRPEVVPRLAADLPDSMRPRLVLAHHEGGPVAAAVIGICGDTAFYVFGASDARALRIRAGYALQWWILDWLSSQGARWYDLGGEAKDAGLRQFKKGLVGQAGVVVSQRGEFDRWTGRNAWLAANVIYTGRTVRRALRAARAAASRRAQLSLPGRTAGSVGAPQSAPRPCASVELVRVTGSLEREWDAFVDRVRAAPFLRPGWIAAWWRAFGHGSLECFVLRRAGRLRALLPVVRNGATIRSPTNDHTPMFGVLAEGDGEAGELLTALLRSPARRIVLSHLDLSSVGPSLRAGCDATGRTLLVTPLQRSPYLRLTGGSAAAVRALGGKRAAEIRRRRRLLEREGAVRVELGGIDDDVPALLAEGVRVEPSGWKGVAGTAIASRPETRTFYTDVAHWAAARGWLRLTFLRLDDRPLAFQLALQEGGVYYLVKCGHDPAYRRFGPGKLLVDELIRHAADAGLERFEFLGDDEPWKRDWTTETRACHLVHLFPRSPLGMIESTAATLYQHWMRPLAKRILRRSKRSQLAEPALPREPSGSLDLAGCGRRS